MTACTVVFSNRTPSNWKVQIVEIGAKWWYKDDDDIPTGGSDMDHRRVRLSTGQSDSLVSPSEECVFQTLSLVKVKAGNSDPEIFQRRDASGPDKCLVRVGVVLAPRSASVLEALSADKSLDEILSEITLEDAKSLGLISDSDETANAKMT